MLLLKRKQGQTIYLTYEDIKVIVKIVRVGLGNSVQVGISAPEGVCILRGELLDRDKARDEGTSRKAKISAGMGKGRRSYNNASSSEGRSV